MPSTEDFIFKGPFNPQQTGNSSWSAPSNIALVKYWGKKENQIPANPSLSFTLSQCKTETSIAFSPKSKDIRFSFDFLFEGHSKEVFRPKIENYFERIAYYCPYVNDFHFAIESLNTFPHSSGIASSASGMAALSVNIMDLERQLNPAMTLDYFWKKASFLARLGSGSACRSIQGQVVVWGEHSGITGSTDLYGIEFPEKTHHNFSNYQDTILLIDKGEKQVSSTVGHDLMHNHPFAKRRFEQAHDNLKAMQNILVSGDLESFVQLIESEALTLHAMMMTSMPYFMLMKPNTLEVLNRIWQFRQETKLPIGFTLDAGANVHVLYPENEKVKILQFIKNELVGYCQKEQYICDEIGNGAQKIQH